MAFIKPQSPIKDLNTGDSIYPLTTADQVVMPDGSRLNSVFKHTVRTNITLLASNWFSNAPYTQTITLDDYIDNLKVDANIVYSGIEETDLELNKAASCLSYIKKNGKNIIFYCLSNKPEIDIPIEISYESLNSIATVGTYEEIDLDDELAEQAELIGELQEALQGKMGKGVLDFSIVGGASQPTNPEENTIWVQTDDEENIVIEKWSFGAEEPANLVDGMVWIVTGVYSSVKFDAIKDNDIQLYLISAKQYISGTWVDKTAKSYQGEEWVEWIRYDYIYKSGEGAVKNIAGRIRPENITITDDKITIQSSAGAAIIMTDAVDMSKYAYLKVDCKVTQNNISGNPPGKLCMANTSSPGTSGTNNTSVYPLSIELPVSNARQIVILPLSETGTLYPCIAGCVYCEIYNWWLEE